MRHHLAAAAMLAGLAGPVAAAPITDLFSSFVALGDSLSDNGNAYAASDKTAPLPPYFNGRFSDGPVWNESILAEFAAAGLPAANLAFGGARAIPDGDAIPDLPLQAAAAGLAGLWGGAEDLVSVWSGSNDAFAAVGTPIQKALVEAAADSVIATIAGMAMAGVENVLVFTLPDLGETPLYRLLRPALAPEATLAAQHFNDRLLAGLNLLDLVDTTDLFVVDTFGTLDTSSYAESVFPCFFPDPEVAAAFGRPQVCSDPEDHVYFDLVHPSARVHSQIGALARETLGATPAPVPLPAGGALLLAALALLGLRRRR